MFCVVLVDRDNNSERVAVSIYQDMFPMKCNTFNNLPRSAI